MGAVKMKNVFETTVLSMSGLELKSVAGRAVDNRSNIFNMSENVRGSIIKIIMISPAGAEGINLKKRRTDGA